MVESATTELNWAPSRMHVIELVAGALEIGLVVVDVGDDDDLRVDAGCATSPGEAEPLITLMRINILYDQV